MHLFHFLLACWLAFPVVAVPRHYYVSAAGSETGDGSLEHPFAHLSQVNQLILRPGDRVLLEGGKTFSGQLQLTALRRSKVSANIVVESYGNGRATIASGDTAGIVIQRASDIILRNLNLQGSGRLSGNNSNGIAVYHATGITVSNIRVSGYQKSGVLFYNVRGGMIDSVYAFDNGAAGITIDGDWQQYHSDNILLYRCHAENNPGDPTNLTNHSGNGIVVGNAKKVTVKYCVANNNGWDMPRKGNGPVGIWAWESDSVLIQYCISYQNKTSSGSSDGGGFDLDGGVKNSIIDHCLSYENQGAGFALFQYDGASAWYNNSYSNNISENDGMGSDAQGAIYVWNSSGDSAQFRDAIFENNIVYNSLGPALRYSKDSRHQHFLFRRNNWVAKDTLIQGVSQGSRFDQNNWWSLSGVPPGVPGTNRKPSFRQPGEAKLTNPALIYQWPNYRNR